MACGTRTNFTGKGIVKVRTVSGKTVNWALSGYIPPANETRPRSQYHLRARALLRELFPVDIILEEIGLPETQLTFDFVIPRKMLCVEVQGEQHYERSAFFHKDSLSFGNAQKNDAVKRNWCLDNNLQLIELPFSEDDSQWRIRLTQV